MWISPVLPALSPHAAPAAPRCCPGRAPAPSLCPHLCPLSTLGNRGSAPCQTLGSIHWGWKKSSAAIDSHLRPITTVATRPWHWVPRPVCPQTPPGTVTPPPESSAWALLCSQNAVPRNVLCHGCERQGPKVTAARRGSLSFWQQSLLSIPLDAKGPARFAGSLAVV